MIFQSILHSYAEDAKAKFVSLGTSSPEDQLKPIVGSLVVDSGKALGTKVTYRTETNLTEHKVRPDISIDVDGLIVGYIELKKPGLGADAPKLKGEHNKKQWLRLKNLPNLIYTDGKEWALYHKGERQGRILKFSGDPTSEGTSAIEHRDVHDFESLIRNFLTRKPHVPHKPEGLAKYLAPLTRFLRSEVEAALLVPGSNVNLLATEWRQFFFPDADDGQFADAYAQTVTYAMLLARLSGAKGMSPTEAAEKLNKGNGLLARALELLGQSGARQELQVGFELLQRSMEALDPSEFLKTKPDLWLYFYEDFLKEYDPKLRDDYGVYYTPREVVELQLRLTTELLETRFNKKLGFADDGVVFLDPAVGTGTYLVAAVKHALQKVEARSGIGAVPARASQMAENMHGFEFLVGPYAVAHLRLAQSLTGAGATIRDRLHVYLADTLESPNASPPGGLTLTYKDFTDEHEAARRVKQGGDILVCLGNPPYNRGDADQEKGGWVRYGDQVKGGAKQTEQGERPILADFTEPAQCAGEGTHLKNLYNDYVYFWRWALWRLFEQQDSGGIVTFITASSYLAGPGFIGMREIMRRTFDELWIIDLGGDNLGTRKTPNVFKIRTPVAIAIGIRSNKPVSNVPANVYYTKIDADNRESKLAALDVKNDFSDFEWKDCLNEWHSPFLPAGQGDFFNWPKLTDLMPWSHSGAQFKRAWPIGETPALLENRWRQLVEAPAAARKKLFRETTGWKITKTVKEGLPGEGEPSIDAADEKARPPITIDYAFRSFDRHKAFYDFRLGDRLRPPLFAVVGNKQVFLTTLGTKVLGTGPGLTAAAYLPDMDHFCGRGAKDIFPLYRDAQGGQPNITKGLLEILSANYKMDVGAEDVIAYVCAIMGGQSYTRRFWNELETPGPRIPITKNSEVFSDAVALGRRLVWLHTYGERFQDDGRGNEVPKGNAECIAAIPNTPEKYPETNSYVPLSKEVHIGQGRFGPVSKEIWEFEVSGLKVVQSWLGYRMKKRAGKKSSPLDDIRPECWTPTMTDEFLELLWVLEATLEMEPKLSAVLDRVVAGECFVASELPTPTKAEREPPKPRKSADEKSPTFL